MISFIFGFLGFLGPKVKWVLISKVFQNLGFLPRFACHHVLLSFLGTMWVMDLDDPFGYQFDHFCMLCCIEMRVAPVLPTLCSVE